MNLPNKQSYLDALGEELALATGQAIWSFSKIEWLTYQYIKLLSHDDLEQLFPNLMFNARIDVLQKLILRSQTPEPQKEKALKYLNCARDLADQRNLIVHNPWQIWIDFAKRDFMTEIHKYSNRNKKLNLNAVREFSKKSQSVASDLEEALQPFSLLNE